MELLLLFLPLLLAILPFVALAGLSIHLLIALLVFFVKFFLPVCLAALLLPLLFPKRLRRKAYKVAVIIALLLEGIMWHDILFESHTIELPPAEVVAKIDFVVYDFNSDTKEWKKREDLVTSDIKYYELLNENIEGKKLKRELLENTDTYQYTAVFYGEDGEELCTLKFYGENQLSINRGKYTEYFRYKDKEAVFNGAMTALRDDLDLIESTKKWQTYGEEFKASVCYENDEILFTVPEDIPKGYRITTSIGKKRKNDSGEIEDVRLELQWEHERKLDWEPGKTYAINMGDPVSYLDITFSCEGGYEIVIHCIDLLPEKYVQVIE